VKIIPAKQAVDRLEPSAYKNRCQAIIRRDGWKCQFCGTLSNLTVHHKKFRSSAAIQDQIRKRI